MTKDEIKTLTYLGYASGTISNLKSRGGYKREQDREMLRLATVGAKVEGRIK